MCHRVTRRADQVQRQQPLQNLLIRDLVRPTVRIQHRLAQLLVCQVEPGGALVVEVSEGALFEFFFLGILYVDLLTAFVVSHGVPSHLS